MHGDAVKSTLVYKETEVVVYMFRPDRELCPVPEPDSFATRFQNGLPGSGTGCPVRELDNHVPSRSRTLSGSGTGQLSCPVRELATHVSSQWSPVLSSEVSVAIEYLTMLEGIHDSETVLTCKSILYSREYTLIKYCINQRIKFKQFYICTLDEKPVSIILKCWYTLYNSNRSRNQIWTVP